MSSDQRNSSRNTSSFSLSIQEDYTNLIEGNAVAPPTQLDHRIRAHIESDLSQSHPKTIWLKLLSAHAATSLATLAVCPQLGVGFVDQGLSHYFMGLGEWGCNAACGGFFLGTSAFIAALLLSPAELQRIRSQRELFLGIIAFLSLGAFWMLSPLAVSDLALAWSLGALLSGEITWALGAFLKTNLAPNRS